MKTLVHILLERAQQQPHMVGYRMLGEDGVENERLTYKDLDNKAKRVAACLQTLGIKGERVLLLYSPGLEFICAFMGCLYAANTAVPAHPPGHGRSTKRFQALAADCGSTLALTTRVLKSRLQQSHGAGPTNLQFVETDTLDPELESRWHSEEIRPDQTAFLQYTSGSTASPKGVVVTHENLMYTQALLQEAFDQTQNSIVLSWLPFYHDMGLIGGILQPLFTGSRCILMPPMQFLHQPLSWLQAISKYRATTSGGPNFAYDYCVRKVTTEQRKELDLSCWQVAFNGSEPVRVATLESFAEKFAACGFRKEAFQPCYGLAEATLLVSGFRRHNSPVVRTFCSDDLQRNEAVAPSDPVKATKLVSSGGISAADRVIIVNPESFTPCADRIVGEVWVSGTAVAKGYWQKPIDTEAVFGARLSDEQNRTFLKTGDLGFLDDGELFITGRLKDLIIIRGVNHWPQDIEESVCKCHSFLDAASGAAFSITDDLRSEKLVIVQEVEKRPGVDFADIITQIRTEVSMRHELQPASIVLIRKGTIPKTSSGKIQRYACREEFLSGRLSVIAEWHHAGAPTGLESFTADSLESFEEIQSWLRRELGSLLGVDPGAIDPELPLSRCGLDSLTAIEMTHRIEALGIKLLATRFLEAATIGAIAAEILATPRGDFHDSFEPALVHGSRYDLSYGQRALWFLQRMAPENSSYNLSVAILIHHAIDRSALKKSFQTLVARHPSLRTTFTETNSYPVQTVHDFLEPSFVEHNAVTWTAEFLRQRMAEEMNTAFDLETGPLIRISLYSRGENEIVLQVTVHHLIADFWSLGIALEEISQSYAAETGMVASEPSVKAPFYKEFVEQESALLNGPEGERLWKFWQQSMTGELSVCTLPTDRSRDVSHTHAGKTERARISQHLAADLKAFARDQGCTLYTVLLAAFKTLLFRYTDCDDILVGSPAAGRISANSSRLIGYCVNPLPLRTRIDPNSSFSKLMTSVHETVIGAFAHQQYPFPLLVEKLQPERTAARTALFQIMFTFLGKMPGHPAELVPLAMGESGAKGRLHNLEFESVALDEQSIDFDLVLVGGDAGDDVTLAIHYRSDLFDSPTIVRMIGHLQTVLGNILEVPAGILSDVALMRDKEVEELIRAGGGPRVNYPQKCIHQLIEETVQKNPISTAIVFGSEEISYDLMNRRANQLAHHLRRAGAAPDVRIGICVDRSADMIVAMLAILKSGAAYVPLDPTYPKDRLSYMAEDAGIVAIVTTQRRAGLFSLIQSVKVCIDSDAATIARGPSVNLSQTATPENLAYVIYTSGSTGRPKGVMITHRSVVNFFSAMDGSIGDKLGAWLALTSISFDISVLELLWTLSRGFQVEVSQDRIPIAAGKKTRSNPATKLDFSLFYFAATDGVNNSSQYRLLLESARFADQHGFKAVWTPERHFHTFGGLYPNPSVTGAALAAVTSRIRIRAGSVVLPLHHPVRVAEEWSVVDNLSDGRVDVSFASGWHANDFIFAPEHYAVRKEQMIRGIETVCKLWRGEAISVKNGFGEEVKIRISPRPCQPELPVWITAAGSNETFRLAGELRAGLLTHLLGQNLEELEEKIAIYRASWRRSGAPGEGHVSLMLHTFLGKDMDTVREKVRGPFCEYLRNSVSLISGFARSLNIDLEPENCTSADMDTLLQYAFERYFETSGLFGTPERCVEMAYKLRDMGVDEIACLVDFGIDHESVLQGLEYLNFVREQTANENNPRRRRITHLQCTPSMAKMLINDPQLAETIGSVDKLLVGGEAVTPSLLEMLAAGTHKEIYNMYGPTETTIWSAMEQIAVPAREIPLGRPIANTQICILDRSFNPLPPGVPGEICIGGDGLARGYLAHPTLTAAKFIPDPLSNAHGARVYRTGDKGRWRSDGKLEFLGRLDFQVKVRGHRIECGEIEACLSAYSGIRDVAVKTFQDVDGNTSLAAYIVPQSDQAPSSVELREFMAEQLPEYMIPSHYITLAELPLTPNGKIDRNRLPVVVLSDDHSSEEYVAPRCALERVLAGLWSEMLNLEKVSIYSNFFSIGGHSLLATAFVSKVRDLLQADLSLQMFFKNPTVASLSAAMLRDTGGQLNNMAETLEAVTSLSEEETESALRAQVANLSLGVML